MPFFCNTVVVIDHGNTVANSTTCFTRTPVENLKKPGPAAAPSPRPKVEVKEELKPPVPSNRRYKKTRDNLDLVGVKQSSDNPHSYMKHIIS